MIPVKLQPEPSKFDELVRQPGIAWLNSKKITNNSPRRAKTKFKPLWRKFTEELWVSYSGVCAYLAIYFEFSTGAASTDHFIPISRDPWQAYEWSNYRLSSLSPNRNKNKFDDVIDPIGMAADTFELCLASGKISPGKALAPDVREKARKTIERLKLNSVRNCLMRVRHYTNYARTRDVEGLRQFSPFVWYEAQRQGLL
jgi:uncharacterized protein (TIGR02646 family)